MAVVLAVRAVLIISPTAYRVVKWQQSSSGQPGPSSIPRYLWNRLQGDESDQALTSAVGEFTGMLSSVETISGAFELRKAQVRWGRDSGAAAGTDDAVTTHHFVKLASGSPSASWVEADFTAAEARFATFVTTYKTFFGVKLKYKQVRWYKAGPSIAPPQAPVRIIDPNVAGTYVATAEQMPPQLAISVTEKTTDAKSWGRFYLPAGAHLNTDGNGRVDTALLTEWADALDAMYEGFITDSTPAVVYSAAKPSRTTAGGTTLAATVARALPVKSLQLDDLFDVIRSRRWNEPLLRVQRDIANA